MLPAGYPRWNVTGMLAADHARIIIRICLSCICSGWSASEAYWQATPALPQAWLCTGPAGVQARARVARCACRALASNLLQVTTTPADGAVTEVTSLQVRRLTQSPSPSRTRTAASSLIEAADLDL